MPLLNELNIRIVVVFLMLLFSSCSTQQNGPNIQNIVSEYYQVYQERNDFQKFLDYYDEAVVLEDIILGERVFTKVELEKFFDWENASFAKRDSVALVITEQIVEEKQVVSKGYFTPFTWNDSTFEAMHFTTLLTFNEKGKIQKQVDWINYPSSLLNYSSRKKSNEWILIKGGK